MDNQNYPNNQQPPQYQQQPYQQQPYQQPNYGYQQPNPKRPLKPDNYLVWAILSTLLCCIPLGVVSIVYSTKVDGLYNAGDYQGAQQASNNAKQWAIISAVAGIVVGIIAFAGGFFGAMSGMQ